MHEAEHMSKRGRFRRTGPIGILIATAVAVFVAIWPVVGDGCIAGILACLSVLPIASGLLGSDSVPASRSVLP